MLHPFRDVDDIAGMEGHRRLAPFLIPPFARHADEDLACAMVDVPVVAASGLKRDVGHGKRGLLAALQILRDERSQVTPAGEILGVCRVGLTLGPGSCRGIGGIVALRQSLLAEITHQLGHLFRRIAHAHGALLMGSQLRGHALEGSQGGNGHYLAVGGRELVAGENVAEEMRLQIVVVLRTESIVEGAATHLGLRFGSHLERQAGIVPHLRTLPRSPFIAGLACRLAFVEHLRQGSKCIERTGKASVGIELGESFLEFVDGHTAVEGFVDGRRQAVEVALCLKTCNSGKVQLTLGQCGSHRIMDCCHDY